LERRDAQFVNLSDDQWLQQGKLVMSIFEHQHGLARSLTAETARGASVLPDEAGASYAPALRYSSPLPWALAIVIGAGLWAGIGWLVWRFV
jgi:hypothetical protein